MTYSKISDYERMAVESRQLSHVKESPRGLSFLIALKLTQIEK